MDIHQTKDGKFVAAIYNASKKRFRTTLTNSYNPAEADTIDDLPNVRKYASRKSVARALRNLSNR